MSYADDLDDREAGRADMTALLDEDPADWPAAAWCPAHGWHIPVATGCPHCTGLRVAHTLAMRQAD
jgi:protein gp37